MDGRDDYLFQLSTKTTNVCLNKGNKLSKSNSFFNWLIGLATLFAPSLCCQCNPNLIAMSFSLSPNKSFMFLCLKQAYLAFVELHLQVHPSRSSLIKPYEGVPKLQLLYTCSIHDSRNHYSQCGQGRSIKFVHQCHCRN